MRAQIMIDVLYRHVDGHDYFYALSEILDSAREVIFILVSGLPINTFKSADTIYRTGG